MVSLPVVVLLVVAPFASCQTKHCGNPADIVFLIDTSRSIWPPYFKDELAYLQNITKEFDVGPNKTRIGALSFSVGARKEFDIDFYDTKDRVIEALGQVYFTKGDGTHTDRGLNLLKNMFRSGRKTVPHIALVVTDGQSTYMKKTLKAAAEARESGIQIFTVGIGKRINMEELRGMASSPATQYVHHLESFDRLSKLTGVLGLAACQLTTVAPTTPTTTVAVYPTGSNSVKSFEARKACGGKPADITFVMDVSSSIEPEDFTAQLEFVKEVVDIFDIGRDEAHVAAVSFSDNAKLEFKLNEFTNKGKLQRRLLKVPHTQGSTFTDRALKMVKDEVLLERNGFRRSVAHVVIVITDGQSKDPDLTAQVAAELKKKGVYIFAIGVGGDTDLTELIAIASSPSWNFVFHVDSYDALSSMKNLLAIRTCIVKNRGMQGDQPNQCARVNPADVMFVADFSGAGGADVTRAKNAVRTAAKTLNIGEDRTRVGLLTNECPDMSSIDLNEHFFYDELIAELETPNVKSLSSLLATARQRLTSTRFGARRNSKKAVVIMVNGPINKLKEVSFLLKSLRRKMKVVLVRGNGAADVKQLHNLAEDFATVVEYDSKKFNSELAEAICAAIS